ncbi:ankyrin repeat family protein [Rhynchospora pubera]|uniref:Ankyrin repeat family protein n=1 Tax=Rhynchospora pubera TaxID=906938 RepID=A0AAV8BPK6_9POAL|nr:ankyrin repeat family protein [Rhynchospora pubera]
MGGHAATAMYLIAHGADPVIPDKEGWTPLHWQPKLVKFLLSSGVPVDIEFDRVTCTPLATAALHGQARTMEVLLEHHADVNITTGDEFTPLFYSVTMGSLECTKLLIKYGWLPIEVAAMTKEVDIVEMLFPLTSPVSEVHDWSVQGILQYVDSSAFYQKVIDLDSAEETGDAALFSNRSLCWQRMGEGGRALKDALTAQRLRPEWPKAHYRVGAAMMLLEEYKQASEAFMAGLQLDPTNMEIKKAYREAVDCLRRSSSHEESK